MSIQPSSMVSPHHRRVRAAFAGEWPDRIPFTEQAFASSVASEILGREVHTGSTELHFEESLAWLQGETAHQEFVARLYEDAAALARALDFDIYHTPWRQPARPTKRLDECTLLYGNPDGDDWWIGQFDPPSRTFSLREKACPVLACEQAVELMRRELAEPPPAGKPEVDPDLRRVLRAYGDEFVVAGGGGFSVSMESGWLEATVLEPGLLAEYLDRKVEWNLAYLEAQRDAGIWLIKGGGDFAFNTGPIYSPTFFRDVMAPRWKRMFDRCRELGLAYIFRSDGNLWTVADSLFGWAKPDAYYECDYDAGMRFPELRKKFPDLVLMGNVSCDLLVTGTPEQVSQRTLECIESAGPRLVAGSANAILHGTPVANVLAMYETARNFRIPTNTVPPRGIRS